MGVSSFNSLIVVFVGNSRRSKLDYFPNFYENVNLKSSKPTSFFFVAEKLQPKGKLDTLSHV